jgi:hypothetical protein
MILIDVLGAFHAAKQRISPPFDMNGLPDLRAASDIMWGMWEWSIQNGSPKTLRWLFVRMYPWRTIFRYLLFLHILLRHVRRLRHPLHR